MSYLTSTGKDPSEARSNANPHALAEARQETVDMLRFWAVRSQESWTLCRYKGSLT